MPIRRGEPWGTVVPRPDGLVTVDDDAALADTLEHGDPPPLALAGGDLHRTLGRPRVGGPGSKVRRVPLDVLRCEIDGEPVTAVAHVVARRPGWLGWWRGPIRAVLNVGHVADWDVAPNGHPGDGRAEVVDVDETMSVRQRWAARRRLPTGAHLPHPCIRLTHRVEVTWDLDGSLEVHVDGRRRGRPRTVRVTVIPDAYELHV
ncbi:MAG: hypothetical protein WD225_05015 [Ilumatobacteraceae bacterium]